MRTLILIIIIFFSKNLFSEEADLYCECEINKTTMWVTINGEYGDLEKETEKCSEFDFEIKIKVKEKIVSGNSVFFYPHFGINYEESQNDIVFYSKVFFGNAQEDGEYHKMTLNRKSGKLFEERIDNSFREGKLVGQSKFSTFYSCSEMENIF